MLSTNPLDRQAYEKHTVEHVGMFLHEYFKGVWPETAHIYLDEVAQANDITPTDEAGVEYLETSTGTLWVIVYPATGIEVAIGIGVVALIASVAAILLIPEVPSIKTPKQRENELRGGSPNNSLSNRTNVSRLGQRVPYMFGTVKSIPDKLMPEYSIYVDHVQQEIGYYCVGEGDFDIADSKLVRDGDSPIETIDKASAHVYGQGQAPTGTGPFSGPVLAIGDPIDDPVLNVYELSSVNGQVLEPFNSKTVYGASKFRDIDGSYTNSAAAIDYQTFFTPMNVEYVNSTTGIIHLPYSKNPEEVRDRVFIGDKLFIYAPLYLSSGAPAPNLQTSTVEPFANAPTVTALNDDPFFNRVKATVSIPAALSAQWALVPAYVAGLVLGSTVVGGFDAPFFEVTPLTDLYIGPFFVDFEHAPGSQNQHVICNFVAGGGLYADDGTNINKIDVSIAIEVAPADPSGVATGPWEVKNDITTVLRGSDVTDGQRAITIRFTPSFQGRFLIRARRVTDRYRRHELPTFVEGANYPNVANTPNGERAFGGRIADEIRWVNCYSVSTPPNISFGGVTTVHTKTVATQGAVRVKQRELNLVVTRKIATWNGSIFTGPLVANGDAENVLFTIMKDISVGNRPDAQIDFAGIAAAAEAVRDYFNDSNTGTLATLVAHTFDDASTSFEEMVTVIANLAFCTIYRQGNILKMKPEIETDDGVAAFNHRNVLPGSMKITHTLGAPTEHDSVEVEYFDPFDTALTSVKVPTTGNFFATRTVGIVGLHTRKQALWHAFRAFQKMNHQRQSLEMRTTQEGGMTIIRDRILVADLTQPNRQNGHVVKVSGLNLTLSQSISTTPGVTYTIFLQHTDGTVEGIPLSVIADNVVTLATAPSVTLVTNPASGVPTIFNIVPDDTADPFAYMVSEQSAENNFVFNLSAVNYSNFYYFGDALGAWIQKQVKDSSPEEHPYTTDHSLPTPTDPDRGVMFDFDGANELKVNGAVGPPFHTDLTRVDRGYSFAVWCRHDSTPSFGYSGLMQSTDDSTVLFGFFDNNLASGHNNTLSNSFALTPGNLHMVGVTYNPVTGRQAIFVDGKVVHFATVAAPALPSVPFTYGKQYNGRADNFMRWKRCLSDRAMMELYLKTKL